MTIKNKEIVYASRFIRLVSFIIDLIIAFLLVSLFFLPIIIMEENNIISVNESFMGLIMIILLVFYFTFMEKNNYLIGKKIFHLKTISIINNNNINYIQSFIKSIYSMIFSIFYITPIGILYSIALSLTNTEVLIRDRLSNTRVILSKK